MTGIAGYAKIAYNHVADNKWKYAAGAAGLAFVGFAAYTGRPQIACNLAKAAFSKLGQGLSYVNKNGVSPALTYAAQNKVLVGVSAALTLGLLHLNRKVSAARKETAELGSDVLGKQAESLASKTNALKDLVDALSKEMNGAQGSHGVFPTLFGDNNTKGLVSQLGTLQNTLAMHTKTTTQFQEQIKALQQQITVLTAALNNKADKEPAA